MNKSAQKLHESLQTIYEINGVKKFGINRLKEIATVSDIKTPTAQKYAILSLEQNGHLQHEEGGMWSYHPVNTDLQQKPESLRLYSGLKRIHKNLSLINHEISKSKDLQRYTPETTKIQNQLAAVIQEIENEEKLPKEKPLLEGNRHES